MVELFAEHLGAQGDQLLLCGPGQTSLHRAAGSAQPGSLRQNHFCGGGGAKGKLKAVIGYVVLEDGFLIPILL